MKKAQSNRYKLFSIILGYMTASLKKSASYIIEKLMLKHLYQYFKLNTGAYRQGRQEGNTPDESTVFTPDYSANKSFDPVKEAKTVLERSIIKNSLSRLSDSLKLYPLT